MAKEIDWIVSVKHTPATEAPDCSVFSHISKVAPNSPADKIGLQAGDLLVSVDGKQVAHDALMEHLAGQTTNVVWEFYQPKTNTHLHVESKSLALGFNAEASTHSILQEARGEGAEDGLMVELLWQRQEWDALREASDHLTFDNWFSDFVRLFKKDFLLSIGTLFKGVVLYEQGDQSAGIKKIETFVKHEMHHHTTSIHAIAFYYLARWSRRNHNTSGQQYFLQLADEANRGFWETIDEAIDREYEGIKAIHARWKNQEFPVQYDLPRLVGDGTVSLASTLASMKGDEMVPVCVMPGYRGNGPYNDIMGCYRACYQGVSHHLKPMHVITNVTERRKDREF